MDNDNIGVFIGEALKDVDIEKQWLYIVDLLCKNGGEGSNLNADMLDGHHADYFLTKESLDIEVLKPGVYIGQTPIAGEYTPNKQYLTANDSKHSSAAELQSHVVTPSSITANYQQHDLVYNKLEVQDIINKLTEYTSYNIEWLKRKTNYAEANSKFYMDESIQEEIQEIKNDINTIKSNLTELTTAVNRLDTTLSNSINTN